MIIVRNKEFTVKSKTEEGYELIGPKGGEAHLIKAKHGWFLIQGIKVTETKIKDNEIIEAA